MIHRIFGKIANLYRRSQAVDRREMIAAVISGLVAAKGGQGQVSSPSTSTGQPQANKHAYWLVWRHLEEKK